MLLFTAQTLPAQEEPVKSRSFELFEWGCSIGYGFVNEDIPEGNYGPILLMSHLEFHAHRKKRDSSSNHFFLVFAEPQVNPVILDGGIKEWEAGVNIGLKYLVRIKDKNGLFFHAGSGPQYISLESPEHQADGFAFANNFGMGYQRALKKNVDITIGYRFRHLSNLGINEPNLGLDNHFFTVGFKKTFPYRVQERRYRKALGLSESE